MSENVKKMLLAGFADVWDDDDIPKSATFVMAKAQLAFWEAALEDCGKTTAGKALGIDLGRSHTTRLRNFLGCSCAHL